MAKPNYRQQKKSKEEARKVRQAEKLQRRRPRPEDEPTAAGNESTAATASVPTKLT
jgi:hypothetical protein